MVFFVRVPARPNKLSRYPRRHPREIKAFFAFDRRPGLRVWRAVRFKLVRPAEARRVMIKSWEHSGQGVCCVNISGSWPKFHSSS